MKAKILAALLAASVLLIAGCSPTSTGTITGKSTNPGHFVSTTSCHPSGKTTVCTPSIYWQPPTWRLDLRRGEKTGWVYVGQAEFDSYSVGEVYP